MPYFLRTQISNKKRAEESISKIRVRFSEQGLTLNEADEIMRCLSLELSAHDRKKCIVDSVEE